MRAHTIFVVEGVSGDSYEGSTWLAAWAATRAEAQATAEVMTREAEVAYLRVQDGEVERDEVRMTMHDRRHVHSSRDPARYRVIAVHDAPPDALEPCPWCDREFPAGTDFYWRYADGQSHSDDRLTQRFIHKVAPEARVETCPQTPWMRFCWMWWPIAHRAYNARPR